MPRKKSAAYMSAGEQIAGTVLFVIYLVVLPFAAGPLFRLLGGLCGGRGGEHRSGIAFSRPGGKQNHSGEKEGSQNQPMFFSHDKPPSEKALYCSYAI